MDFQYDDLVSPYGSGGGAPSGWRRSTYTAICTTLAAYERATGKKRHENYVNADGRALLDKLDGLVHEFLDVRHPDATGLGEKKSAEVDAVKSLRSAIEAMKTVRRLSALLDDHHLLAQHPYGGNCTLIRHSMAGWIDLLGRDVYRVEESSDDKINAQVQVDGRLLTHPSNLFSTSFELWQRGPFVPVAVLVHEYHHHLTRGWNPPAAVYLDEFVAHWKQYDAMGVIAEMGGAEKVAARLNYWLLDDPSGYRRRPEVPKGAEIQGPAYAGPEFWDNHLDNAR